MTPADSPALLLAEARRRDPDRYLCALFAPAEVWVSHLDSGRTWHAGALEMALLRRLWLEEA